MTHVGPLYPGSAPVDDPTTTVGAVAWTNPGNAQTQDNSGATVSIDRTNASHYLIANTFGPSLPAGCTLNGLVVEVRAKRTSGTGTGSILSAQWCGLAFSKGSWSLSTYGSAKTNTSGLTGSFAYYTFGASNDVWSITNPIGDFNADSTGVAVQVSTGDPADTPAFEVDTVRATYYYTPAATGGAVRLLLMGCGAILSAASAWLGYLPWLRSKLWHAGYWLKGGWWTTCRLKTA